MKLTFNSESLIMCLVGLGPCSAYKVLAAVSIFADIAQGKKGELPLSDKEWVFYAMLLNETKEAHDKDND